MLLFFFFQAEDGIRDAQESRGLGRLLPEEQTEACLCAEALIAEELGRRRGELPGRMKLHRSVCTALGMMAVLLLI